MNLILETITAALILGLPFYAAWGYYFLTGNYLGF
jgi:hypothetical protein